MTFKDWFCIFPWLFQIDTIHIFLCLFTFFLQTLSTHNKQKNKMPFSFGFINKKQRKHCCQIIKTKAEVMKKITIHVELNNQQQNGPISKHKLGILMFFY